MNRIEKQISCHPDAAKGLKDQFPTAVQCSDNPVRHRARSGSHVRSVPTFLSHYHSRRNALFRSRKTQKWRSESRTKRSWKSKSRQSCRMHGLSAKPTRYRAIDLGNVSTESSELMNIGNGAQKGSRSTGKNRDEGDSLVTIHAPKLMPHCLSFHPRIVTSH